MDITTAALRIRTNRAIRLRLDTVDTATGVTLGTLGECLAELAAREAALGTFRDAWLTGNGATHI